MTSNPQLCPALPPGWRREVVVRLSGASAGGRDVYYYSPSGKKCRSKKEMSPHLDDDDVDLLAQFNFASGQMHAKRSHDPSGQMRAKRSHDPTGQMHAKRSHDPTQRQLNRAAAIAKVIAEVTTKVPRRRQCSLKLKKAAGIWRPVDESRKTISPSDADAAPVKQKNLAEDVVGEDHGRHVTQEKVGDHDETMSQYLGKKLGEDDDAAQMDLSDPTRPEHLEGSKGEEDEEDEEDEDTRVARKKTKSPVKKPVNAFMLWAANERRKKEKNSYSVWAVFAKLLGSRWRSMTAQEKQPWVEEQERVRKAFAEKYPDFKTTRSNKRNEGGAAGERLHATDKRLHGADKRLHSAGEKLNASDKRLNAAGKRLHATGKRLHATGKRLHATGKPRQKKKNKKLSQRQEEGQPCSARGRGPPSSHKARRKSKDVHVDTSPPHCALRRNFKEVHVDTSPPHSALRRKSKDVHVDTSPPHSALRRTSKEVHVDTSPTHSALRRTSKEVHVDTSPTHSAGHPNKPPRTTQEERAATDAPPLGGRVGGTSDGGTRQGPSSVKVAPLSSVRTMNWTLDELVRWMEHQSGALRQSEALPATDIIATLVRLYWGGSVTELRDAITRYSGRPFMDEVAEFCAERVTSDTVVLSHVLCSWSAMRDAYHVLDGRVQNEAPNRVHTEAPYASSWLNVDGQLDAIDKEFGFPPSLRCSTERDEPSRSKPESGDDCETAEKEDVETETDSGDPFSSLQIHVLPPDEAMAVFNQLCSYQAKREESEKLFNGSAALDELCEVAISGKTDSDAPGEDNVRSVLEEYCVETMVERCPAARELVNLKDDTELHRQPNASTVGNLYRSSIIGGKKHFNNNNNNETDTPVPTSRVGDGRGRTERSGTDRGDTPPSGMDEGLTSLRNEDTPCDTPPGESGCASVDTSAKLSLFGSDSGQRVVNPLGITRANCTHVFFPPRIVDVIDAPVVTLSDAPHSTSPAFNGVPPKRGPGRPRKSTQPKFVKPGSWWSFYRSRHVYPSYNP